MLSFELVLRIKELPPAISQLQGLEHFSIASNQLQVLPPDISELPKLVRLNVSMNE